MTLFLRASRQGIRCLPLKPEGLACKLGGSIVNYYSLMLDTSGVVRAVLTLDCEDDRTAVDCARNELMAADCYDAAEIWRGRERIGKVRRPPILRDLAQ